MVASRIGTGAKIRGNLTRPQGILPAKTEEKISREYSMSSMSFHSSRPDRWTQPKPYSDSSLRMRTHGPILPMEEPGFLARLFGRR